MLQGTFRGLRPFRLLSSAIGEKMMEKILIALLSLLFLGGFITRNLIVKAKTKQPIRASDPIVFAAMVFTNLCIFAAIFSIFSISFYNLLGVISFLKSPVIAFVGLALFAISIIMGWLFAAQMKGSWRVGVNDDQKTELIQNGIYRYVRNPYFITYFIIFFSLFLVRPSIVMIVLIIINIVIFHRMVIKEETHLLKIHGAQYEQYKKETGRYVPRFSKRHSGRLK
jgi:protein-S-isoprenylcysteine O-methyltransferase Ste14